MKREEIAQAVLTGLVSRQGVVDESGDMRVNLVAIAEVFADAVEEAAKAAVRKKAEHEASVKSMEAAHAAREKEAERRKSLFPASVAAPKRSAKKKASRKSR